jgi:hypothetical protein
VEEQPKPAAKPSARVVAKPQHGVSVAVRN